ncbi:MAG: response regulator [Pirellulales bacterium]|nr:response regulator [Pirellulales bacterium]
MSNRVLFVDDEASLLNGIKRRLGSQLNLVTACSGEEGLTAIAEQGPFSVIVTDMRMPKMDGVQFVKAAREKTPNSVFVMLTGNQDQATTIQALNEGHVFRFLNKPCQSHDLLAAVEAAQKQHELIVSEKELLQGTFVGAVGVLTDVLELAQPRLFGRAERIQELVGEIQKQFHLEGRWEYKLGAKLALLGFALLPEQERTRFEMGLDCRQELHEHIREAAAIGRRVIERIPRLGMVARIIGAMGATQGHVPPSSAKDDASLIETGATLVRAAIEWDFLVRQGLSSHAAAEELAQSLPDLNATIVDVLGDQVDETPCGNPTECAATELTEGMVLQEDVLTSDGTILIRRGRRLTWTIIEKLRGYQTSEVNLRPILIQSTETGSPQEPLLV